MYLEEFNYIFLGRSTLIFQGLQHCQGIPSLSNFTILTIKVGDVNDNDPTFETSNFNFKIPENDQDGILVGTVVARDDDKDPENSRITYSFTDTGNKGPFELNSNTGEIFTKKAMDAEIWGENNQWNFEISARDHGKPSRRSKPAKVTIHLVDINDHAPKILKPDQKKDVLMLRNIEFGDLVLEEIIAEDLDATAPNNKVFFQLGKHRI